MGWVVNPTSRLLYSREKPQYPLYRKLDGPQGWSGRVRNISPPPGFDPHRNKGKGKGTVRPRTGHEGPEGEKYSSTLSLTSAMDGLGG